MSTRSTSIFKDPNVAKHLSLLHDKYVIVSADKAPNNIVFAEKKILVISLRVERITRNVEYFMCFT